MGPTTKQSMSFVTCDRSGGLKSSTCLVGTGPSSIPTAAPTGPSYKPSAVPTLTPTAVATAVGYLVHANYATDAYSYYSSNSYYSSGVQVCPGVLEYLVVTALGVCFQSGVGVYTIYTAVDTASENYFYAAPGQIAVVKATYSDHACTQSLSTYPSYYATSCDRGSLYYLSFTYPTLPGGKFFLSR